MYISFSPQWRGDSLSASKSGDVLTINGAEFDFTDLPDGATIPEGEVPCELIVGPVERIDGQIHVTLLLPHGPTPSSALAFPTPITITEDGELDIPWETYQETKEEAVPGGALMIVTTYQWHQDPVVSTTFIPTAEPKDVSSEETTDVEA